jgi:hypothetical protein
MNFSNGRNFAKENESFGLVRAVRSFKPATASEIEQAKLDEQKRLQDEKRRLEEEKKKIEEEKKKSEDAKLATQIKINEIANSTIAIGNLIVSKIDCPELMFWYEAKEACSKLGEGWRLPTIDELRILYENKNIIGSFSEKGYWSSSKGSYDGVVNYIYFENGHLGEDYNKFGMNYVRAVKNKTISIKQEREKRSAQNSNEATIQSITNNNDLLVWWNNNITTIKIGNLEVASKDFPQRMIWDDAQKACQKLGNGWRMPNSAELILLHKNKSKIGGFADGSYWSSTDTEAGKPIAFDGIQGARGLTFGDGKHAYYSKADDCNVRAVRNN